MIIFMIIFFNKLFIEYTIIKQDFSRNLNIATRYEFANVAIIFSTNNQKHITKTRIDEKKTFEKTANSKKCVECVTKNNRKLSNKNFRK
jgi:hypothetical protein